MRTENQPENDAQKHRQLYYLCKMWGFLHYYHSVDAHGGVVREDLLRASIEKIFSSTAPNTFTPSINSLAISLMNDFGVRTAPRPLLPSSWDKPGMIRQVDVRWLRDSVFDNLTQSELEALPTRSLPLQSLHYLDSDSTNKRIIRAKSVMLRTTIGRTESLMALFIFWNAVNYMSPHKARFSKNWDTLLLEYIPQFLRVNSNSEYVIAMMKLRSELNDSHASIISPDVQSALGKYTIPMRFTILDSQIVIQEILCCDSLTMMKGWIIEEINGTPARTLITSFSPLVAASNDAVRQREIARMLCMSKEPQASLIVSNGVTKKRLTIDCSQTATSTTQQASQQKKYYQFFDMVLKDTLVYADLGMVEKSDLTTMFQILAGKKGVIFDLRKYPSFIVYDIMQRLTNPTSFGAMSVMQLQYPGYHSQPNPLLCGKQQEYLGRIVVLVNEWTQSRGEFTAQAMRTIPNMKIVGSQTAGADGDIIKIVLPMNLTAHFTIAAVFDREMKSMQGVGILPDVEVRPTPEGIRAGRDEVLEKGVEVLREMINTKK